MKFPIQALILTVSLLSISGMARAEEAGPGGQLVGCAAAGAAGYGVKMAVQAATKSRLSGFATAGLVGGGCITGISIVRDVTSAEAAEAPSENSLSQEEAAANSEE